MEEKLGDYRLIKLIGHGLFGKVYLAEHLYMQQQVTLKVLPSELAKDRSFLSRLQKEIAAVSSIDHPHVAKVQSVSFAEGKYFVVTDYVPSPHGAEPMNLNDYIREVSPKEPLKEKVVLGLARQVASALDAIHAKNVNGAPLAHLALRPSNILVSNMLTQPSFILTDTGMTRVLGVSSCFDAILEDMKSDGERAAALEGKRARFVQNYSFLAPEQKLSRDEQLHGYRCDLYALGTLLYYLLVRSYPEGVFPLPSLHRSLLLNWDRLIMGLLKQDPSQRVPLEPGKLLETINSIAVPADKRSPMQETQKPKQESSAPKREAEIPLQKNGAKALQSASHNVSQNAALDSFQGPFQGASQGASQNTPQTATQNIPQNTPHNIPQRTLQSASQSSCQSKAQRRSLSEPLSEPLSEYSAGVSPKALGASQSANAPAAPSVSLSRQDSRSPAAAALATEVVKTSSSLSLDRPQVDRPQVDRPQVDRPQVDSAVDKDQERLKQMASFQAHAVEEKRPGDVQAKSSSLSEPSWRSEPLESSELKKETKGFQFFDRASGREKELEEKEAQILGRASAYVDRLDRSSVASPPKQRVVIQEARLESEKRESASSGGAIFPSEASSAVGTFRSMTREPEADNRVEPILCDMVQIKGGKYLRGSNDGSRDEMPVHEVEIEDFALDTHPVTNEQFLRFLQHFGSEKDNSNNDMIRLKESRIKRSGGKLIVEAGYAKHPIVGVTWYGATAYCRWVGKRLPTEVEWEVASRGGDAAAIYPCGEKIEKQQANFFNSDTTTVKSYPPNGLGLYDMAGNVYEWCADWYAYNTYELSASEPYCPKGPLQGVYRVLRGGCWKSLKEDLRCAHRHRNNPGAINRTYGFRCAADTAQKAGKVEKKRAKARPKESAGEKESAT